MPHPHQYLISKLLLCCCCCCCFKLTLKHHCGIAGKVVTCDAKNPSWVPVLILAASFPIWLPANVLAVTADDGSSGWAIVPMWVTQRELPDPMLSLAQT